MQAFFVSVLIKLWQDPKVRAWLDRHLDDLKAKIGQWITDELKQWLPVFVKTLVASVAQAAGQLVVNTEDKVTDIIPGQLDDKILDPIVRPVLDQISQWTGIKF